MSARASHNQCGPVSKGLMRHKTRALYCSAEQADKACNCRAHNFVPLLQRKDDVDSLSVLPHIQPHAMPLTVRQSSPFVRSYLQQWQVLPLLNNKLRNLEQPDLLRNRSGAVQRSSDHAWLAFEPNIRVAWLCRGRKRHNAHA